MAVGIDNVLISRMNHLSKHFPNRILSKREYQLYLETKDKASFLAGRFAGKEAYIKASGRLGLKYSVIEVLNDEKGKPLLFVEGKRVGEISLTHDFIATAIVLL